MKRTIATLLLAAALLLAGCHQPTTDMPLPDEWVVLPQADEGAFSEHGYYYTTPQGVLYFLDLTNGGNVALCSRVGCKHELETYPEEDCEAYLDILPMSSLPLFYENEKIYYVASDYYGQQLYSRNADGTAKTHIATLGKEYYAQQKSIEIYEYLVVGGMLYYTAEVRGEVQDDLSDYTQIVREFDVLGRVDLRTGKDEQLLKDANNVLQLEAVGGNAVIYLSTAQADYDDPDYMEKLVSTRIMLNLDTGTSVDLMEKPHSQIGHLIQIENDQMYVLANDAITAHDIKTGESKETVCKVSEWFKVINAKYAYCHDSDQKLSQIYDIENKTFLPGGIVGMRLRLLNVGKDGFVVQRSYPKPGGSASTGYETDYYYLCYCSFASLSDGFQRSDLIPFSFVDC